VYAHTETNGSIAINQASGPVQAITNHGGITIHDAKNSVIAQTSKGKITVHCASIPATGSIQLTTNSGMITLAMPTSANATIQGQTTHGTLLSEHYLTIKPQTTKLNDDAWARFKKEVHGTLGTGESAIKLSSVHSNIKIVDTTAHS